MKRLLIVCLLSCTVTTLFAQSFNEYSAVDMKALGIPASQTATAALIANYINDNFKTNKEKFRAIYAWVTGNIRYSTDSMYIINWATDDNEKVVAALRRRKGVCENFAAVFNDIALKAGLRSVVVNGYTRQGASIVHSGHAWCAVNVDDKWLLCDPTWDEGYRNSTRYFLIDPSDFITEHFPFDPMWQLMDYPVTSKDFNRGLVSTKKTGPVFNFVDSINNFYLLTELQQNESVIRRMSRSGLETDMQENWLAYTRMKTAIAYGEKDMELYNGAVRDLNNATNIFNSFVQYRNDHFTPQKSDAQIRIMLEPANGAILSAWQKISQIGRVIENFQYNTEGLTQRLTKLTQRIQEQKDFLRQYFAQNVADRSRLFYN